MKKNLIMAGALLVILAQSYFLFLGPSPYEKMEKSILEYEKAHFVPEEHSTIYFPYEGTLVVRNKKIQEVINNLPVTVKDAIIAQFIFPDNLEQLRVLMRTIGESHWKMDAAEKVLIGRRLFNNSDYVMKMKIQGYYPPDYYYSADE